MAEVNKLPIQIPVRKAAGNQNKEAGVRNQSDRQEDSFGQVMEDTVSAAETKDTRDVKHSKDSKDVKDSEEVKDSKDVKTDEGGQTEADSLLGVNIVPTFAEPAVLVQNLCSEAAAAVRPDIQPLLTEGQAAAAEPVIPAAVQQTVMVTPQTAVLAETQAETVQQPEAGKTADTEASQGESKQPTGTQTAHELKAVVKVENAGEKATAETTAKSAGETVSKTTAGLESTSAAAAETETVPGAKHETQPETEADKLDVRVLQQMSGEPETPRLQTEEPVRIKVAEPFNNVDKNLTRQLGDQITQNISEGKQELQIQLEPENLGKITIKITVLNEEVKVLLNCDNQKTLGLLAERSDGLGRIIENNMKTPVVVEVKEDNYWSQQKNATDQHGNRNGSQQEQEKENRKDESDGFLQQMRLGILEDRVAAG